LKKDHPGNINSIVVMSYKKKLFSEKIEIIEEIGLLVDRVSIILLSVLSGGSLLCFLINGIEYNYLKLSFYLILLSVIGWLMLSFLLLLMKKKFAAKCDNNLRKKSKRDFLLERH
jgi:uncharacterized membrane protein